MNRIIVKRANIKIREYQLSNTHVGMFSKRLLKEVIQKDGSGNIFNRHKFKYFDDVKIFDGNPALTYSTPKDNADVGPFSGGSTSMISGTYSKNKNRRGAFSIGASAGCFLFGINKKNTFGVTVSRDNNQSHGQNQLLDIDGDGLLDKVFLSSNGSLSFRKNLKTSFSGVSSTIGLPGGTPIYRHNLKNLTLGLEYSFALGVVGANYSTGSSNSPTYFSDVNGDGLLDMINYGDVFFGRIRNNVPHFTAQSPTGTFNVTEETPNAILAGRAAIQDTITTTQAASSLAHVVRMWEAPVSGNITVVNRTILSQSSVDGVDVWIEKGGMIKQQEDNIGYNSPNSTVISTTATLTNQNQSQSQSANTYVEKGQRIFVIVSSKSDPNGDLVDIDTDIRYTSVSGVGDYTLKDANDNHYFKFNAREHYLASSKQSNAVADQGKVNISWNSLSNVILTDDVDFKIYKSVMSATDTTSVISPSSSTLIYHHKLLKGSSLSSVVPSNNLVANSDISNLLINQNSTNPTITFLHFDVSSDTNVSWEKIKWNPTLNVMSATDTTAVKALVQYNPFSERHINTLYKNFDKYRDHPFCEIKDCPRCKNSSNPYYLFPDFNGNTSLNNYTISLNQPRNSKVTFSLKIKDHNGNIYTAKNTVNVVNNVMPIPKIDICAFFATIPLSFSEICELPFYFEVSSPDYVINKKLSSVNPYIIHSGFIGDPLLENTGHKADYFSYRSENTHYNINTGLVYQGWGGFSYNGSKYPNQAIRESEFTSNPFVNLPAPGGPSPCNPSAPDYITCMINLITQQNNNRYFTPLQLDAELNAYLSPMEDVELSGTHVKPYVLGISSTTNTVITTPVYTTPNPRGIILRSENDGFHGYLSGSILPWLGVSGHVGVSSDKTSDYFQDFNGDRYPDIISGRYYQKTNPLGQLDQEYSIGEKEIKNNGTVVGVGIAGSTSIAKFSNTANSFFAIGAEKDSHTTGSSFGLGVGINVGIGSAWFKGSGVWADINGDGLTDYISNGYSHINTGNGFVVDGNGWSVSEVTNGDSFAVSGGGGFSFANGSWAIGVGLSKSKSTANVGLIDMNGDGLADKIVKNGNTYGMLINSGTSFVSFDNFNRDFSLDNKQNSSGFNIYGTGCLCFGVKFCLSAGLNNDKSVTKQEVDLRDFDGDGYPDLLVSDSEGAVSVYRNQLGRANLLNTIENPLKGLIEIGYDNKNVRNDNNSLIGGTYQMPFSKTVFSNLTIWNFRYIDTTMIGENVNPQPTEPAQAFEFVYEKGIQDRREREFLGFGIVKTKVKNNQALHQTIVTHYETDFTGQENNFYVNYNDTKVRQYFYKKGLVKSKYILDSQNRKRSETKYTYRYFDQPSSSQYNLGDTQTQPQFKDIGRIIPLLYKTETTFTEFSGTNSHTKTTASIITAYDKYGNVLRSVDQGNVVGTTSDDIITTNVYHAPGAKNIVGIPSEQTVVKFSDGNLMRKNTTVLDAAQNIKQIKKHLIANTSQNTVATADYDKEYDSYGNMTKVTYPLSENQQRSVYKYFYDPVYHTYPVYTIDANNFVSTIQYDSNYLFGVPVSTTSINGETSQFTYDSFGRLTQYRAPTDTEWTIKLHYFPSQIVPVAITERKWAGIPSTDQISNYFVSLFSDAWGEPIASKKLLFKDINDIYYFSNNIYQIKDKLGRPVKTVLTDKVTPGTDIMTSLKTFDDYTSADDLAIPTYTTTVYDELDRPVKTTQHNVATNNGVQNLMTQIFYEFGPDKLGNTQFATRVVSPLGNTTVTYTDEKGRTTSSKQTASGSNLWVSYKYDILGQLTEMTDPGNKTTEYGYDKLGRLTAKKQPDMGESVYLYDMSGKLTHSANNGLQAIGNKIHYKYNFDHLIEIEYPDHVVTYEYGNGTGPVEERGRLIRQTDRTGTQTLKYDQWGNVKENMRIVAAPHNTPKMFKTSYIYDVYGRVNMIKYPDTEEVTYSYTMTGLLGKISSRIGMEKPTNIIYDIKYDNRDQMTSYLARNGTKTEYNLDPWGRVKELGLLYTNGNALIRKNQYTFDWNGNLARVRGLTPLTGNFPSMDMGIATDKTYTYDPFGRLNAAEITARGRQYSKFYKLKMNYNAAGNIATKDFGLKSYQNGLCQYPQNEGDVGTYQYNNPAHPNAVSAIVYNKYQNFNSPLDCGNPPPSAAVTGIELFTYDLNGNLTSIKEELENGSTDYRSLFWDHDNRLKAVATQKENFNYYVYDASGERILKNDAVSKRLYVNGNDPSSTTQMGHFTYYPNGLLVLNDKTMSKHYYMGSTKVATRVSQIPTHRFKIDVGGVYDDIAAHLSSDITTLVQQAGLPPEVWVQNEDSQGTYNSPVTSGTSDVSCQLAMEQQMQIFLEDKNEDCYQQLSSYFEQALQDGNFCQAWTEFLGKECMIGYTPPEPFLESEMYWIHPDHFSGASILVNSGGEVTNWYEYMPYGEMLMENSTMSYDHPFKYNGKELDMATGYYYYGARYYDPKRSFWLSVDPLVDLTVSPYAYVWNDPVNYADPTGMMGERVGGKGPNPDNLFRKIFWSKAHRNAQRYANKMQFGENSVNMYKHNDGDWSVDTNFGNGLHNRATFSNQGEVYNKNYGIYTGDIEGQIEGSSTITNYPAPNPWDASVSSPSWYQGQSQYEIVMVKTNPLMPVIASMVCPPAGAVAGAATVASDVSDGNYKSAAIGAVLLFTPARSEEGFFLNKQGNLTDGFFTVSKEAMLKHKVDLGIGGKSIFYSTINADEAVLKAAQYAEKNKLWIYNGGTKAKVPVLNTNIGTLSNGQPTNFINVYKNAKNVVHGAPGTPIK